MKVVKASVSTTINHVEHGKSKHRHLEKDLNYIQVNQLKVSVYFRIPDVEIRGYSASLVPATVIAICFFWLIYIVTVVMYVGAPFLILRSGF